MTEIIDKFLVYESLLIDRLGWPAWSCRSIEVLVTLVALLFFFQMFIAPDATVDPANDQRHQTVTKSKKLEFRWFQAQYLVVYLVIMLADWLQGTNMYTLYSVRILHA